jgi:hypothetical protein
LSVARTFGCVKRGADFRGFRRSGATMVVGSFASAYNKHDTHAKDRAGVPGGLFRHRRLQNAMGKHRFASGWALAHARGR